MFLSSNVTQVAVISGWNGLYVSMRPQWYTTHLELVMGAMPGAQWVTNGRCGEGLSYHKNLMSEGHSAARSCPLQSHPVAVISGWNDSYGSMGLMGHIRHLALVMGSMSGAQWVPNGDWSGSFLALSKSSCLRGIQWPLMA